MVLSLVFLGDDHPTSLFVFRDRFFISYLGLVYFHPKPKIF